MIKWAPVTADVKCLGRSLWSKIFAIYIRSEEGKRVSITRGSSSELTGKQKKYELLLLYYYYYIFWCRHFQKLKLKNLKQQQKIYVHTQTIKKIWKENKVQSVNKKKNQFSTFPHFPQNDENGWKNLWNCSSSFICGENWIMMHSLLPEKTLLWMTFFAKKKIKRIWSIIERKKTKFDVIAKQSL